MKSQPKLTAEELAWYKVAARLGKTVVALREEITLSEFEGWLEFLRVEEERDLKEHHYLAQIAAEIRRANPNCRNPADVKLVDFLLRFATPAEKEAALTTEGRKARVAASKSAWLGLSFTPMRGTKPPNLKGQTRRG